MSIATAQTAAVLGDVDELDLNWLRVVLSDEIHDFDVNEIVGEGYASRMYRVQLRCESDADLPESLILKLATQNPEITYLAEETLYREVYFYRDAGDRLGSIVPVVYYADSDPDRGELTLLMEDLGELPHKHFSDSLENSCAAVTALAQAHAVFWESARIEDPVYAPAELQIDMDNMLDVLAQSLEAESRASYSFPYLNKLVRHAIKLTPWMLDELKHVNGPHTLVHGDFHTRNVHVEDHRATLFDWQQAERGAPARDLVYWMLMCVDAEDIDEFEPVIIDAYLNALREAGVEDYSRKEFDGAYRDMVSSLVGRIYSFQVLIDFTEEDLPYLEKMLKRADYLARKNHLLAIARIGRVLVPPVITILRWLGKR